MRIDRYNEVGNKVFDARKISLSRITPYLFVAPTLILLVALVMYPIVYGMVTSLFDTNLTTEWNFVGIQKYIEIFSDGSFWKQLLLTFKFTLFVVGGHFVIGILYGLLLNKKIRFGTLFKVILILPWIFPEVVTALIFKWILNPIYGMLNMMLNSVGLIEENISWLGDEKFAFVTVVLVCIWKGFPLVMMNILAGLQSVPSDVYEAAKMDGAGKFRTLWNVTLPSIRPVIITSIILDTIWWFKHYTMISLMTQGGPGSTTSIISLEIYKEAFSYFDFGKASAMSVIVFVICIVISKVYRKVFKDDE